MNQSGAIDAEQKSEGESKGTTGQMRGLPDMRMQIAAGMAEIISASKTAEGQMISL